MRALRFAVLASVLIMLVALGVAHAFAGDMPEPQGTRMVVDDKLVIGAFGVLAAAIGLMWRHQVKMHKDCEKQHQGCEQRLQSVWIHVCTLMGIDDPPDEIPMPPPQRRGALYTSKNHPHRRKTDRPPNR